MLSEKERLKFQQDKYSIRLAYEINVFSKEYAKRKFAKLYADTFGIFSGIYRELNMDEFEECFID